MEVLLGDSVELSCLIENKSGQLIWSRDDWPFSRDTLNPGFSNRYSLPYVNQQTLLSSQSANDSSSYRAASISEEELFSSSAISSLNNNYISNYNLLIKNVTLQDDAYYQCKLQEKRTGILIDSRKARLTVLVPPTSLNIKIKNITSSLEPTELSSIELRQVSLSKSFLRYEIIFS